MKLLIILIIFNVSCASRMLNRNRRGCTEGIAAQCVTAAAKTRKPVERIVLLDRACLLGDAPSCQAVKVIRQENPALPGHKPVSLQEYDLYGQNK